MAGHSKWANIKHRKAAADAKKGKVFTRLIKEITVAAKLGGADANANPRLRLAMDKAREANMTKDSVQSAIKRGAGDVDAVKAALEKAGLKPELSEITWKPTSDAQLAGDQRGRMRSLVDALENLDDVQNVYTTAVID